MSIEIINSGILTIVVDSGRKGYRKLGIPTSGAMDAFAHEAANVLVGNDKNEAMFEFSLTAPDMIFLSDAVIAVTGADFSPEIDGVFAPMWESILVKKGSVLSFGSLKSGCRGYLAISGGFENIPEVMGSKTTFIRAGIGGYKGRPLKAGDILTSAVEEKPLSELSGNRLVSIPTYSNEYVVRVILGPQDDFFTDDGIRTFLNSGYSVTNQFDRMGYRLDGNAIETMAGSDIISEGIVVGSIQIPGDGKPIIIMEDGQTVGGYTKIATVISSDLWMIAQAKSGDVIRFKSISIEESHDLLSKRITDINNYIKINDKKPIEKRQFAVTIENKRYDVVVEEF
jgi:biotin-dependent carboxylase-like uncharacterized protein